MSLFEQLAQGMYFQTLKGYTAYMVKEITQTSITFKNHKGEDFRTFSKETFEKKFGNCILSTSHKFKQLEKLYKDTKKHKHTTLLTKKTY